MAKDSRFNGRTVEEMRVYAPNNGSLAYKSDYLYDTRLAAAQPKRRQETAAPAETQPKIRPQKTRIPLSVTLRERKVGIKLPVCRGCPDFSVSLPDKAREGF